MFLKAIEMRGFKSFADKTVVSFGEGITCVVGPNGSGKSNITDAVRWVLGEQRAKTLRGAKMEDVIFSGTRHRKALGLAEVRLIFDNTDHFFPIDYHELEVTRRIHRSGESEYFINQMPCRLKDIRELIMDTGIGREGYSIIGQGRIDEILSANREDRRLIFEEAAGITKYKYRRVEAEKKLVRTQDNLSRIQDILNEVEGQLEPLREDSERASMYLNMSENLKAIEVGDFVRRFERCEARRIEDQKAYADLEAERRMILEDERLSRERYEAQDAEVFSCNTRLRDLETELYTLQSAIQKNTSERALIEEKRLHTGKDRQRIEVELRAFEDGRDGIQEKREALDSEMVQLTTRLDRLAAQSTDQKREFEDREQALTRDRAALETIRRAVLDALNQIEVDKQGAEHQVRLIEALKEKQCALTDSESAFNQSLEAHRSVQQDHESRLTALRAAQQQGDRQKEGYLNRSAFLREALEQARRDADKAHEQRMTIQAEYNLLKALEDEYDGYDQGVKEILSRLEDKRGIVGVVAELISVSKRYEKAIEVALGRSVQHMVCASASDAGRMIRFLHKNDLGRVTFLPLDSLEGSDPQQLQLKQARSVQGFIGVAGDLVESAPAHRVMVDYLLGRVLLAESFESAREIAAIPGIKYKVITLEGDVLNPRGSITGGRFKGRISNILGRKRRIEELEVASEACGMRFDEAERRREDFERERQVNAASLESISRELDAAALEISKLEHAQESRDRQYELDMARKQEFERDRNRLEADLSAAMSSQAAMLARAASAADTVAALEVEILEKKSASERLEGEVDALRNQLTQLQIEMAGVAQERSFLKREQDRIEDEVSGFEHKKELRRAHIHTLEEEEAAYSVQLEGLAEQCQALEADMSATKAAIEAHRAKRDALQEALRGIAQHLEQLLSKKEVLNTAHHKLDIQQAKLEVERDGIIAELFDKYDMSIAQAYEIPRADASQAELKRLRNAIKAMGPVNLGAIEAYAALSERYTFLNGQRGDLLAAMAQLNQIIEELERKMTKLFLDHFAKVQVFFKETFQQLFGGGDAGLELLDMEDVLNCDIEIVAQPPGKRLQSLNLLSGGEKALTAIGLLFAILSTKPTPFCILDEIEAALDDVNVFRFSEFITRYAVQSQFIVITHRKGTMESADTLYGVTMEEYGVSKILGVQLADMDWVDA